MWNQVKTIALLGVLAAIAVSIVSYIAPGWALIAVAVAVVMNLAAYFCSDRLVLRMHRARPITVDMHPQLHQMNNQLAREARVAPPRLFVIDVEHANAFATGRGPGHAAIAVTRGLLDRLTVRELRGVLAHEMAHVANRDILIATVAAMFAAAVNGVANALQFSAMFGSSQSDEEGSSSPLGALLVACIAPIGVLLVQLAISRSREFVADATAARLTGDPDSLASALRRLATADAQPVATAVPAMASLYIVNPFTGASSRLQRWFSTHPPMEERIARLLLLSRGFRRVA